MNTTVVLNTIFFTTKNASRVRACTLALGLELGLVDRDPFLPDPLLARLVRGAEPSLASHLLVPFHPYLLLPPLPSLAPPFIYIPHNTIKNETKSTCMNVHIKVLLHKFQIYKIPISVIRSCIDRPILIYILCSYKIIYYPRQGAPELRGSCRRCRRGQRSRLP